MSSELIINSFYFFFLSTIITKIVLLKLNISHINKHFSNVPDAYQEIISKEDHIKAQKYSIVKNKFSVCSIIFQGIILLVWLMTPALDMLINFISSFEFNTILTGVLVILSFTMIGSILDIPFSIYSTFKIEEDFGFNKTTPKLFITDFLKQILLSLMIGIPFLYLLLSIFHSLGDLWWFYSWIFILVFQFVIIWAYPKFIAPLFNKFEKLSDDELEEKINSLSQKTKIPFKDYYTMNASLRSAHGNAYFTGFGKNKRIVFFDTLLKTLNANEVIAVLAHELGHLHRKHILKSIITSSIFLFIGLYILGILENASEFYSAFNLNNNSKSTALLLFLIITPFYTYFMTPLSSWFSRKNEYEADEFAALNANPQDLINALLKMYKDNSSTLTPHPFYSKFYYSHPPADERIKFLSNFIKHK